MVEQTLKGYSIPARRTREEAWGLLEKTIAQEKNQKNLQVARLNWLVGFASAAAVFIAVLYLGMFSTGKYSPEISTGIAQVETVNLPDGSNIQLNSNSAVKYHVNKLTGERNIVLEGEAFFDVEKGGKFHVNFEGGIVRVKGTEFYVSAYSSDMIQVDCVEGEVEVTLNGNDYYLEKNKGIKLYHGAISGPFAITKPEVRERLEGLFFWDVINLQEMGELMGYRFGYSFQMDQGLLQRNFSGRLELNDLQLSLMVMATAMELDFTIDEENKRISIHAK